MTGPATPNPAATTWSEEMCGAAWRENSFTIKSKCANSLLANRCLNTVVSLPFFSVKSARLHFVPPTSPARITCPPRRCVAAWFYSSLVPGLRITPMPAFAFEQKVGLARAPTSRGILRNAGRFRRAPHIENRIDKRPTRFDAVAAIEQRGIAADAVAHQRGISAARAIAKSFPVAEVHGDVPDVHLRTRALGAERNGNAFVGLNI